MLNLSPTNCEGNGDSPDVIVDSPPEDDYVDISQFVESVLEEPEEDPKPPPPMVYFPNQNAVKSSFSGNIQVPVLSQSSRPLYDVGSGIRPVQTVGSGLRPVQTVGSGLRPVQTVGSGLRPVPAVTYTAPVPPLHHVYPGKTILLNNQGHSSGENELSISWLKDCFEKVKTSSTTFTQQVKCLEERLRCITSASDTKKIMSFSNDLQSLLKQSELGYKYLGTNLALDHQAWTVKASQRRLTTNMMSNGTQNSLVAQQILLPISANNNTLSVLLPSNIIISVNGNNQSLSARTTDSALDEKQIAELCAKYEIKPCYVNLERCDAGDDSDTDNDVEIIEELIAL